MQKSETVNQTTHEWRNTHFVTLFIRNAIAYMITGCILYAGNGNFFLYFFKQTVKSYLIFSRVWKRGLTV